MPRRRRALALLFGLLVGGTAIGTQVAVGTSSCPVDGTAVRVFQRLSSNRLGGWDSNLAAYSTQGQWRQYAIATCPEDLYTVYGEDMATPLSEPELAAVRARLATLSARLPPSDQLEVWHRYGIAAELYAVLGSGPLELAELYLRGSWTARDAAVGVYQGLEGPIPARALLDAGKAELARAPDVATRKILLHNLARVAHRGGFSAERDQHLDAFEAAGPLTEQEGRVLDRFRAVVTEIEPGLQAQALAQFQLWLDTNPGPGADKARAVYLVGDLSRRLGRHPEAAAAFGRLLAMPEAPEDLRQLAAFLTGQLDR